jgi:hypothetical protein
LLSKNPLGETPLQYDDLEPSALPSRIEPSSLSFTVIAKNRKIGMVLDLFHHREPISSAALLLI